MGEEEDGTTGQRGQQGRMDHRKKFGFFFQNGGQSNEVLRFCVQKWMVCAEITQSKRPMLGSYRK